MATDRLSKLPDALIQEILSRLPMREVVATMLLSKRWKDLWTTVPCLQFHSESDGDDLRKFRTFISRALALWKGEKIRSLSLRFHMECEDSDIDSWLRFAVEKQVEELCVDSTGGPYDCPDFLYSYSLLKKLTLNFVKFYAIEDLRWNQLKSLTLQRPEPYCLNCMNRLFKGAPLLEFLNLRILEYLGCFAIRPKSLKMLKIEYFPPDPDYTEADLTVDAPDLECLEISGIWHTTCSMNVPSLKTVILGFDNRHNMLLLENSRRRAAEESFRLAFQCISHVENLTLNEWSFTLLVDQMKNQFFVQFPNAKSLKLCIQEAEGIPLALSIFPALETLVIEHKEFYNFLAPRKASFPPLPLTQLKRVKISWDVRDVSMIGVVKSLVDNDRVLDQLVLRLRNEDGASRGLLFSAAKRVTKMLRPSYNVRLVMGND